MQREFIFTDRWLDLLFEHRNRKYGAYVLRKRQPDNVLIGWLTAVALMVSVSIIGYQLNQFSMDNVKQILPDASAVREIYRTIILPETKTATSTAEKKTSAPKQSPNTNLIPVVKNKTDETPVKKEDIKPDVENPGTKTESKDNEPNKTLPDVLETENTAAKLYTISEKMPEFPGGDLALFNFIKRNTHYPRKHISENISGTIWISFVIDADGEVQDIQVLHGIEGYPEFSDAAIESISKMPRWAPGQQNGMNVPVLYKVPVKFSVRK